MKKLFLIICLVCPILIAYSQVDTIKVKKTPQVSLEPTDTDEEPLAEDAVLTFVEQMPDFPGGEQARFRFVADNINFPKTAIEKGIGGTCYVTFVVEKDGSISNVRVLRGVAGCPECDLESVRVIAMMPKWKPGRQNGREVRVQYNLPIKFKVTNPPPPKEQKKQ